MKRFSRHFSRWWQTSSTSTLLSRLPCKRKTLPRCRRKRLRPKIRSGAGDCAETISPKTSISAPSQEGNASWTATLRQSRPYRKGLQVHAKCNFCKLTGHLEAVCRKKACLKARCQMDRCSLLEMVKAAPCHSYGDVSKLYPISFLVSEIPALNLLGRDAIRAMRISLDGLMFSDTTFGKADHHLLAIQHSDRVDRHLQQACWDLCSEFNQLFKPRVGMSSCCATRG